MKDDDRDLATVETGTRLIQYWDYLEVPKLLSLQSPFPAGFDGEPPAVYDPDIGVRSDVADDARSGGVMPPLSGDELFFISVHQSFELWFKVGLASMGIARDHLLAAADDGVDESHLERVAHHLTRSVEVMRMLASQIGVLGTLPGRDFLRMRTRLGTSSGFESYQFRLIERHLGILAEPDDFVHPPPRHRGHLAFIKTYRKSLEDAANESPAVSTKVGAQLYAGTALSGLAEEVGGLAQRRREIDSIEATIRAAYARPSLKDAWFRWLQRRLPHVDPPQGVPSLTLLGVLAGVTARSPIGGIDLGSAATRQRELTLREAASAHRFEEWFRAGHDAIRSAWRARPGDAMWELAAEVRQRQLDTWDKEIGSMLDDAQLAREAEGDTAECFLAVLRRFPVLDRVIRCWLGVSAEASTSVDGDDSFLSVADLKADMESQRLYGRVSGALFETLAEIFPGIRHDHPDGVVGAELVAATERLARAAEKGAFTDHGNSLSEFVWSSVVGALRTPLSAVLAAGCAEDRQSVRVRYALLYFGRVERVRRVIEDSTAVEFPDHDLAVDAERRAHAVGGLASRCLNLLLDLDEAMANWRAHHVAVIARILGTKKGTAGTGTEYLARSLGPRGMPEIIDGIGRVGRPTEATGHR